METKLIVGSLAVGVISILTAVICGLIPMAFDLSQRVEGILSSGFCLGLGTAVVAMFVLGVTFFYMVGGRKI